MVIIFLDEGSRGYLFVPYPTGLGSLLKFLTIFRTGSQCSDDQMCSSYVPDPQRISLVGMNGGYLEDPDSDDEAKNYSQSVLMILGGLLLNPVMILRKEEAVLRGMHPSSL
ncbi:hypothetical protein Adt_14726 [Abeliophyllum distichum]|uniref:Uncharacterized protein n=1 Tax=Abeliophyllum distichum TaxID=126358 RepID=A0ABD1U0H4_9LAMI